ncbi:MAG: fasciclin domain-containing protein [Bacteroidota bacterium]
MKVFKVIMLMMVTMILLAFTSNLNPDKTISEMVAENEDLSTLLTALETAELVDVLNEEGPYTVFAPTNEAFNNLPAGKLDELLKPENKDELTKILKYHVVSGKVMASDLEDGQRIETLEGTELKVTTKSSEEGYMESDEEEAGMEEQEGRRDKVMVNNAKVAEADITVSNGVIHIIDGVVSPEDTEVIGEAKEDSY